MNITLNIQADNPIELQAAIEGLAKQGLVNVTGEAKEVVKTPKKAQAKKESTSSEPKKDVAPKETKKEETPKVEEKQSANAPSVVELRSTAQEKGKTPEGKKAIKALLVEFESKSISNVPEEKRAEFLAKLENL
ncbi:hypothetical protein [Bacillus paranthracis]|uniref:hypothetical protein n=1 Tax=Bacillus paranthracis TaxID=2026186 RepID=UPI0020B83BF6|nr:hypothetical protein MON10_08280 [Bacillus paranthracis]